MLFIDDVPYGILYSFEPEYLARLQAESLEMADARPRGPVRSPAPGVEHKTFAAIAFEFLRRRHH